MLKCLQIMCAKYYELRYMFLQNAPRQGWRICVISLQHQIHVIFRVWFEGRNVDKKKQTYMKTETCKLYSSVF